MAIILAAMAALWVSLPAWGACLVAQDEPQPSDMIVVLMGSGPDRMLGAADLYRDGYADEKV